MKLGVFTCLLSNLSLEQAIPYFQKQGIEAIELGCGGYPGNAHANSRELLADPAKLKALQTLVQNSGLQVSAFSCHGNPLHPQKDLAAAFNEDARNAVLLAEAFGVDTIVTFSGCPGDHEGAKYPNWVTCPWPNDFLDILNWQWQEKLVPYWQEFAAFAQQHGVTKIALEPHPGFCVYNTESLLKLRSAVGNSIGANLDPSHLIWQGMDPVAVIRALGDAIFHFHAKDTKVDRINTSVNGVLDVKPYNEELQRSWLFRSVGYGNDLQYWKDIISNLRLVGYDHVVSIEHEDGLMSQNEGLSKAVVTLKEALITESTGEKWWI